MTFAFEASEAHKSVAEELAIALTLRRTYAWQNFSDLACARLSETERAALAFASLQALPADLAEMTADHALGASTCPLPHFQGGMEEARLWAACAPIAARKALALAAFEALTHRDQAAFLHYVKQKEMAA